MNQLQLQLLDAIVSNPEDKQLWLCLEDSFHDLDDEVSADWCRWVVAKDRWPNKSTFSKATLEIGTWIGKGNYYQWLSTYKTSKDCKAVIPPYLFDFIQSDDESFKTPDCQSEQDAFIQLHSGWLKMGNDYAKKTRYRNCLEWNP